MAYMNLTAELKKSVIAETLRSASTQMLEGVETGPMPFETRQQVVAWLDRLAERAAAGIRDAARQAAGQPACACGHPQDRHNSACAHCPCVGYAQTWPRQAAGQDDTEPVVADDPRRIPADLGLPPAEEIALLRRTVEAVEEGRAELRAENARLRVAIGYAVPLVAQPDPTTADDPTPLRWGLGDVLHGDDDSTIICMSGPGREPYWLELDRERVAALRNDLADPDAPLSPYYSHEACGFHWHGRDGMDIPTRDGQPVCPRCELLRMTAEVVEPCGKWGGCVLETDHSGPHRHTPRRVEVPQDHPGAELYAQLRKAGNDHETTNRLIYAHARMAVRQHQALHGDTPAVGLAAPTNHDTETEAHPMREGWRIEIWDVDGWVPSGLIRPDREVAIEYLAARRKHRPDAKLRLVRETTTWTVEEDETR